MAKQGGLGAALAVGGGPALLDVTTLAQTGMDRLGGKRDAKFDVTVVYDPLVEHPTLSALPTTDVILTFAVPTLAVGAPACCMNSKQTNYDGTRAADGLYTFAVSALPNSYGLEWGNLLTAGIQTDTTATNGASWDTGGSLSYGAQAYLQVFSVTGTSVTVKIQDSADNSSWADVASLAFTAATPAGSPQAQRISIANNATVRRYVRAASTGTFSNAQYAVVLVKNPLAGVIF